MGKFKCNLSNSDYFVTRINVSIDSFSFSVFYRFYPSRFTKINSSSKLSNNNKINSIQNPAQTVFVSDVTNDERYPIIVGVVLRQPVHHLAAHKAALEAHHAVPAVLDAQARAGVARAAQDLVELVLHEVYRGLLLALRLAGDGIEIVLTSGEEEAHPLLAGETVVEMPEGALFSVLGVSDLAGLSIGNAVYPLEDFALPFGAARGVSNKAKGGPVRFGLKNGTGIIILRPHDFSGV